ncbi:MAG TPA: hypothetical protein VHH36_07345, partial [Candidatus Thermoplasmatota archaeon]|nr:hypothetical protein [Candidatus Thermoplasmatota archaeon]
MRVPAALRRRTTRETLLLGGIVAAVFLLLASFFQGEGTSPGKYLTSVAIIMAVYALFALGLSVEMGYAGLLNFGHVAFMGIGGYTAVIFWRRTGATLGPQLAGDGIGGLLFAALVGLVAAAAVYTPLLALARRLRARARIQVAAALAPA